MSLEERVRGFISTEKSSAIAIHGKWGEGKTHFWKQVARKYAPGARQIRPNYAYVSLFGLNSLTELKSTLAQNIRPVEQIDDDTFAALLGLDSLVADTEAVSLWHRVKVVAGRAVNVLRNKNLRRRTLRHTSRQLKNVAGTTADAGVSAPFVSNLGPFYRAYAYSKVRNALLCFDDLERRGKGLALKDVMGLVSQLVEERKCSVTVIFNDATLAGKDKKVWERNKEKVFSGELLYRATPALAVSYIYATHEASDVDNLARDAILSLGITNVRIIERIKNTCDLVFSSIPFEVTFDTKLHIARALVLLVYMHAGQGEGAPPMYRGVKSQVVRIAEKMNRKPDEKPSEQEARWDEQLSRYNFHFGGTMDDLLADAVTQGYPDTDLLLGAVKSYDHQIEQNAREVEFGAAWNLFHGTYLDNGADVVRQMEVAFFKIVDTISAANADSAIRLMRAFQRGDIAERMIVNWVSCRKDDRWQTLEKREVELFDPIVDKAFSDAIGSAYEEARKRQWPSFHDVMASLASDRYLEEVAIDVLNSATEDDYIEYLHASKDRTAGLIVGKLLRTFDDRFKEKTAALHTKIRAALRRLADESATNRIRVEWKFGDLLNASSDAEEES